MSELVNYFDGNKPLMHIECSSQDFEILVSSFQKQYPTLKGSIIRLEDRPYLNDRVITYLNFFKELSGSDHKVEQIAEMFELEEVLRKRIDSLDDTMKRMVQFAAMVMMDQDYILMYEPMIDANHKVLQRFANALELLSKQGMMIVTASSSFRVTTLLPGETFYFREKKLIPIYESLGEEATEYILPRKIDRLSLKVNGKTMMVNVFEILYAESIDSVCHVYVNDHMIATQYTLDQLEKRLEHYGFFRCHRSYIVNIQRVIEVKQWTRNSYVLMVDAPSNCEIPLSKRRYSQLQSLLHSE